MNLSNIPKIAAIGLASMTMLFGGISGALAHWGHLGELAGHGHLVGVALGAAAAVLATALVVKDRGQANSEEDTAEVDGNETGESEGDLTDA
jgi:hypothetical protein